ncbi:MAG: fibrobacter succinogenes major paralogous domain-containing protein [Fibrobacter sp.]|nr:fibrobacter succinogenes major paralogous domain-containing protein [Fibrobacter sp.]
MVWKKNANIGALNKNVFACLLKAGVAISSCAILFACGGDSGSKSSSAAMPPREVPSIYDLGSCTNDRKGDTVLVLDKSIEYLCLNNDWIDITTQPESSSSIAISSGADSVEVPGDSNVVGPVAGSSSSVIDDPLCGDCNSSSSMKATYIEVKTKNALGPCETVDVGLRALVLADSSYYTCKATGWVKDTVYLGYEIVKTKEDLPRCNAGNTKQRVLVKNDSVFFTCDAEKWNPETADGYIVKNASILGAAQKGPFKFNSPLQLREVLLRNDSLVYTGRRYDDEISSNKGDFVIPKVNLVYPYAVLEVRGLWRNEVSGEYSKDSMTLRVLTDLTSRSEVNINLLTHLEYDRAAKLVNEGYSVYAAKKQADYEIMTAFGFATSVEYSEDLKTFVPSTSEGSGRNATLMAISLLFIGDRSEAEIQNAINSFKSDLAEDGEWDNGQMKADMADWAEAFDGASVRANVKSWNILDIPDYENYLTIYWNNAYELGGCSATRSGVIAQNKNSKSKNYNVHYICKVTSWQKATDFEKDTYEWADGEEGEVKKGNVMATYYVFENGKWTVAKNETALGLCTASRNGEVGKIDTTYFICDNKNWRKATVLEYDTDGFGVGDDGEVRVGNVNKDKFYVYENGAWRASANEIENNLGACVTNRLNEVGKSGNKYYTCKTSGWVTATALEYDTYQWSAGTDGEMKPGSVNSSNHYTYADGAWRATANDVEYEFGACVASRSNEKHIQNGKYYICENKAWKQITAEEYGFGYCTASNSGVVENLNDVYYICKSENWVMATTLEYDTYGKTCLEDGSIVGGEVVAENKYVCDAGSFRTANEIEISLNKGCVSFTEYDVIRKQLSEEQDSVYTCKNNVWEESVAIHTVYGTLIDKRDLKTYKTIVIGTQKWMAENLNYADSINYPGMKGRSWCYKNSLDSCAKYGRFYTWAAAMDSAGIFSTNGKNCGCEKTCSPTYPVRGICPVGWRLPTTTEWKTLYSTMGSSPYAMQSKGFEKWPNATDTYFFSALPAGYLHYYGVSFYSAGDEARFWSATETGSYNAYFWRLTAGGAYLDYYANNTRKEDGLSVRCLKDSDE